MRSFFFLFTLIYGSLCSSYTFEVGYYYPYSNCTGQAFYAWGYDYGSSCSSFTTGCIDGKFYECIDPQEAVTALDTLFPYGYVGYAAFSEEFCPESLLSKYYAYPTNCAQTNQFSSSYATGACTTEGNYTVIYDYLCDDNSCSIDSSSCQSYPLGYVYGEGGCFSSTGFSCKTIGQCASSNSSYSGESMEYLVTYQYSEPTSCSGDIVYVTGYYYGEDCSYYNTVDCYGESYTYECVTSLSDVSLDSIFPSGYTGWAHYADATCSEMDQLNAATLYCSSYGSEQDYIEAICYDWNPVEVYVYQCSDMQCDVSNYSSCSSQQIGVSYSEVGQCSEINSQESQKILGTCGTSSLGTYLSLTIMQLFVVVGFLLFV